MEKNIVKIEKQFVIMQNVRLKYQSSIWMARCNDKWISKCKNWGEVLICTNKITIKTILNLKNTRQK